MKKDIAVAITPVQTLGGVHFIGCGDQEKPVFLFEKKPEMILYSPRAVEQPLHKTQTVLQSEFYTARAGGQLSPFSQERVKRAS